MGMPIHMPEVFDKNAFNVYVDSNEPDFLVPQDIESDLEPFVENFDLVLTRRSTFLKRKNARKLVYGTAWVHDHEKFWSSKNGKISFTLSAKVLLNSSGYISRHLLGQRLDEVRKHCSFQIDGFDSERMPTGYPALNKILSSANNGRDEMMYYNYHIAMENSRHENYFTEKLIDCFLTKTIPIYYGCPNISDYFDLNGFYTFTNMQELCDILRSINENTYDEKKEAIEKNYELAKPYEENFSVRLWREVEKYVSEKGLLK
tara:strand:+ start:2281 stop:3060 length:780 start_codon:yes stop_codon:yes gene_type:complete